MLTNIHGIRHLLCQRIADILFLQDHRAAAAATAAFSYSCHGKAISCTGPILHVHISYGWGILLTHFSLTLGQGQGHDPIPAKLLVNSLHFLKIVVGQPFSQDWLVSRWPWMTSAMGDFDLFSEVTGVFWPKPILQFLTRRIF